MTTEDKQEFEEIIIAACSTFDVPHAVFLFRDDTSCCVRAIGNTPEDKAAAKVLAQEVEKLVRDPATKRKVWKAMEEANAQN